MQRQRQSLMRKFHENQSHFNNQQVANRQAQYHQPRKIVNFTSERDEMNISKNSKEPSKQVDKSESKNRSYADLLKDQIKLNKMGGEEELTKSRIIDQQTQKQYRDNYPFGIENMKITEDVIEKYRANKYIEQREIIQKFKSEAEQYRKHRLNKNNKRTSKVVRNSINAIPVASNQRPTIPTEQVLSNNFGQIRIKREIFCKDQNLKQNVYDFVRSNDREQRIKRKNKTKKSDNKAIQSIQNMLKDLSQKLKQNSLKVSEELQNLKRDLTQSNSQYKVKQVQSTQTIDRLLKQADDQSNKGSRIPVVIYNSMLHLNSYPQINTIERLNRSDVNLQHQNYSKFVDILQKNSARLNELANRSEKYQQLKSLDQFKYSF